MILYFCLGLVVSICLDMISIESLDLDNFKKSLPTVEKVSTVEKVLTV